MDVVWGLFVDFFEVVVHWVKYCLSGEFWAAFVGTYNFFFFVVCAALFLYGCFSKNNIARGLCVFWGIAGAIGSVVQYFLIG